MRKENRHHFEISARDHSAKDEKMILIPGLYPARVVFLSWGDFGIDIGLVGPVAGFSVKDLLDRICYRDAAE